MRAADALGVPVAQVVVIGDTVMDVGAAEAAGATGIYVRTDRTRPSEVRRSPLVADDIQAAVDWVLREYRGDVA